MANNYAALRIAAIAREIERDAQTDSMAQKKIASLAEAVEQTRNRLKKSA